MYEQLLDVQNITKELFKQYHAVCNEKTTSQAKYLQRPLFGTFTDKRRFLPAPYCACACSFFASESEPLQTDKIAFKRPILFLS